MNVFCLDLQDGANVYRPPKFAPASMGEEKMSKQERNELRREKERLRNAKQSPYMIDLLNDLEGRPEEVVLYLTIYTNFTEPSCIDY